MATYINGIKTSSTFTNGTKNVSGKTWDEATETLDEATEEEWDVHFLNTTKNSSTFINGTKN